jgi:hypothetical protein
MHTQHIPAVRSLITIRPEIRESTLRLLDQEADRYDGDREIQQLVDVLRSAAEDVRAGRPIDLSQDADCISTLGSWLVGAGIRYQFEDEEIAPHGARLDWRYLSDVAALAADIETAEGVVA